MTALNSLKKLIRENGYLYTQDVTEAGIRREQLKKYLDSGTLIRESRGIYSFADSTNDEFVLLQSRCKKGIFSYGTALYFHGLTDRFPQMVSMTVPKTYNVFYLKEELFHVEFHRIKPSLWDIGITEMISPQGGKITVYDRERCICDMIRNHKQTDPQVFVQALKGYFSSNERDDIRLQEYARQFRIMEKMQMYMEIL
ncbi:MAG: type IV toxin-antitoxin system AbiEi family antitoxin domain-containing protein [Lachnospiraceae bacterium]